jgi:hypothetical protein
VELPPSAISFRRSFAPASWEQVEALNRAGKRHSGLDVALGKVKAKSAGGQRRARLSTPSTVFIAASVTRASQAEGSAASAKSEPSGDFPGKFARGKY